MAKTIGTRTVKQRKTPTITRAEVDEMKEAGRKVTERSGDIVLLDGFRKFKVVGTATAEPEQKREVEPKPDQAVFSEGNDLTDFPSGLPQDGRGRNDLIDFT